MDSMEVPFNSKAIKPLACYSESFKLIKGQYWQLVLVCFIAILIGGLAPMGILLGPMMCGLFFCILRKSKGEAISLGMVFEGFSNFQEGLIAGLLMMVPAFILILPAYFLSIFLFIFAIPPKKSEASLSAGKFVTRMLLAESPIILAVLLVGILIAVVFAFVFPLIAEKKLKAIDAIKLSARAGYANLGGLLGLMLLNFLAGIIGLALCYVGAFLIAPVTYSAKFNAYRQVFPETNA